MARQRRALELDAYLRLWTYMSEQDQIAAICWFSQVHDTYVTEPTAEFRDLVQGYLTRFGIVGTLVGVLLDAFGVFSPSDVLECDRVLGGG